MKNYYYLTLLLFMIMATVGCEDDKICTTCTEQVSEANTAFCGDEIDVQGFETTVVSQAAEGEIWICTRN